MAAETVLAVDDREDTLKFLREYVLEPNGYKMIEARNGAAALEIALTQQVDLIISDLVMPKMGGLELLESLREKGLDTPAILMTFHGSEGTAVHAFRLGARDYIIKPFAVDEMLNAVDRALAESRLRQERDRLMQTVLTVNRQLENRVQELRFLYGVGRSVTSLRDLEQVLNRIVEAAIYLTGAEEGLIMLIDQASGELYLRAARGLGEKNAKTFRLKIQDSIVGQVIRTGRPVMMGGSNQDDSFKVATGYFVKALLNVPLKIADQVIGVLAVNNKTIIRAFSERHLNLLTALADYASIAIENAGLYARLSAEASEAEPASRELKKTVESRPSELEPANRQLLQPEKLVELGYMAAGVAKAMSEPIKTILNNLSQFSDYIEPTTNNLQFLTALEQEALHCQQTVQGLLDFASQKIYQPRETDLNDVIEMAWVKYSRENHTRAEVKVIRSLDPDLPPVWVDRQQIEQALFHLIKNACQAMPHGGAVRITSQLVGTEVQVVIADSSPGISPEDLSHIFDPFYETAQQAYGIGLSIAYSIIEKHQGKLQVESRVGQGTTFTIHLPRSHHEPLAPHQS